MQYEKWEVLTRGQKRLRVAVIAVPTVFNLAGGLAGTVMVDIGFDKVPPIVLFGGVAIVLLGALFSFFTLCIFAYWMREHRRWLYGVMEIFFALVLLVVTVYQSMRGSAAPPGWSFPLVSDLAKYAAAIYVMVRGFDNIGQGVKGDPVWGRRWRWFSLHQVDPPKGD